MTRSAIPAPAPHLALESLLRNAPDALRQIERLLAIEPTSPKLLLLRAQILLAMGELREACAAASAAQRHAPPDPVFFDALGSAFTRANDPQRALQAYERAVSLAPTEPRFLFNRAAVRRFVGALAEAEADYDRVIALDPGDYEAYKNRSDLRTQTAAANHVAELEALLLRKGGGRADGDWRGEVQLRYALAKEYEDLGEHARSFGHLREGARLRRAHLRYDVSHDTATVDWIIEAFADEPSPPANDAARPAKDATLDAAPIFIVGLPRSGSTVVDRILSSHSQVSSAGELDAFALALVAAVRKETGREALPRRELVRCSAALDFPALGREYLRRAGAAVATRSRFTDKMPLNFLYCALIRRALPRARIVHVSRGPLAAGYAVYKTLFENGYPYSYDLGEIGQYYIAYRRLMDHWNRVLPGTIHSVSYERLIADQRGETRKLLEFCGLEWEDACLEFHRNPAPTTTASAAQVRRPLYDSSVSQWRHYAGELSGLREQLCAAGIRCEEEDAR